MKMDIKKKKTSNDKSIMKNPSINGKPPKNLTHPMVESPLIPPRKKAPQRHSPIAASAAAPRLRYHAWSELTGSWENLHRKPARFSHEKWDFPIICSLKPVNWKKEHHGWNDALLRSVSHVSITLALDTKFIRRQSMGVKTMKCPS